MFNKITKVLLADDDNLLCTVVKKIIDMQSDMVIVGIANDGNEALNLIDKTLPDIVLLDMIMPQKDGISVLEEIANIKNSNKPEFIILSSIGRESVIKQTVTLGAAYYMIKPIDLEVLPKRIRHINNERIEVESQKCIVSQENQDIKLEEHIALLLKQIGISTNLKGYTYLRDGLIFAIEENSSFFSVTKILYPKIAKHNNTKPQNVERAIRHAIKTSWRKGTDQMFKNMFSTGIRCAYRHHPTNTEFITQMMEYIKERIVPKINKREFDELKSFIEF